MFRLLVKIVGSRLLYLPSIRVRTGVIELPYCLISYCSTPTAVRGAAAWRKGSTRTGETSGGAAAWLCDAGGGAELRAVQRRKPFSGSGGFPVPVRAGGTAPFRKGNRVLSGKLRPPVRPGDSGLHAAAQPPWGAAGENQAGRTAGGGADDRAAAGVHRIPGGWLFQSLPVFPVLTGE